MPLPGSLPPQRFPSSLGGGGCRTGLRGQGDAQSSQGTRQGCPNSPRVGPPTPSEPLLALDPGPQLYLLNSHPHPIPQGPTQLLWGGGEFGCDETENP